MRNQVIKWQMTEQERLSYIDKNPIIPKKQVKRKDYKWRGDKGRAVRWGNK